MLKMHKFKLIVYYLNSLFSVFAGIHINLLYSDDISKEK